MKFLIFNFQISKMILCTAILSAGMFLVSDKVQAAAIYIEPSSIDISKLEEFRLDVRLDAGEQEINALEAEIVFDETVLSIVDVLDGESVIPIWVERTIDKNGRIILSGLIPGGYSGLINPETGRKEDGLITSLIFRPKLEGSTKVEIKNIQVLANDGKATSIETDAADAYVNILSSENYKKFNFEDATPPKVIDARIYRDSSVGDYFLAFYAEDKESGVSHFEVRIGDGDWVSTENPHYLGKKPHEDLFIKAVDKAGNVDIVKVPKGNFLLPSERAIISITLLLMVVLLLMMTLRKRAVVTDNEKKHN